MKHLRRQLEILWGRSHSVLAFGLQGYEGDCVHEPATAAGDAGDLESSDGVRHPTNSVGTSGFTKEISFGKYMK